PVHTGVRQAGNSRRQTRGLYKFENYDSFNEISRRAKAVTDALKTNNDRQFDAPNGAKVGTLPPIPLTDPEGPAPEGKGRDTRTPCRVRGNVKIDRTVSAEHVIPGN